MYDMCGKGRMLPMVKTRVCNSKYLQTYRQSGLHRRSR